MSREQFPPGGGEVAAVQLAASVGSPPELLPWQLIPASITREPLANVVQQEQSGVPPIAKAPDHEITILAPGPGPTPPVQFVQGEEGIEAPLPDPDPLPLPEPLPEPEPDPLP